MKNKILLLISAICLTIASCSKKATPEDEVVNFISQLGKDSLSLLSDSSLVVSKMNQWKATFKNVKSESYILSDKITSAKKINITLENGKVILLRFYFIGKALYKTNVFPLGDNKSLWDSIIAIQERKYKKSDANTWAIDSQFKTAKVVFIEGYSNMNWSMEAMPKDAPNYLQLSVNLEKAYEYYSQKINPVLADNSSANKFTIDFRSGTVKVPDGKMWVIRKADNYAANDINFGVFDTTKVCECFLKGALESTAFMIINGECVRLGTLWPGYERSILPEKASFCIPNSTVHNKDNGRNEYLYYNQFFIDEYNIQDLAGMNEFSTFLKSMGFLETDFLYVKYLNLLSAKEKPETLVVD